MNPKKIIKSLIKIIIALAIAVGAIASLVLMNEFNFKISGVKDYIFYIIPSINFIASLTGKLLLFITVIFVFTKNNKNKKKDITENNGLINKDTDFNGIKSEKNSIREVTSIKDDIENNLKEESIFYDGAKYLSSKIGKLFTVLILLSLIVASMFVSLGIYDVITDDKLIRKRIFIEEVYSYDDVEFVRLGISSGRKINSSVNLYYDIYLKNGKKIKLLQSSFDTKEDIAYELVVERFDNFIKSKNIKRELDLTFVDRFKRQNYDEEYEENILRILGVKYD